MYNFKIKYITYFIPVHLWSVFMARVANEQSSRPHGNMFLRLGNLVCLNFVTRSLEYGIRYTDSGQRTTDYGVSLSRLTRHNSWQLPTINFPWTGPKKLFDFSCWFYGSANRHNLPGIQNSRIRNMEKPRSEMVTNMAVSSGGWHSIFLQPPVEFALKIS